MMLKKLSYILWIFIFFAPSSYAQEAGGVGIVFDYDPPGSGRAVVFSVTYKSPADKAKMRRGDVLVQVEGNDVRGKSLEEIAALIRGPVGAPVSLTVERNGAPLSFTLTRAPLSKGPVVAVPPPSQMIQSVPTESGGSSGGGFDDSEKALVKQKILSLKSEDERQKMWQLLQDFKSQKLSKNDFLQKVRTEFP